MVILYLSVTKSDHSMKKAFVLIAIAALIVCIIPMVDSSDAAGETTLTGYLDGPSDLSQSSFYQITIVYSSDGENGEEVGKIISTDKTKGEISPWNSDNKNKFTVSIEPSTDKEFAHYYIGFNIYGNSIDPGYISSSTKIKVGGVEDRYYSIVGDSTNIVVGDNAIRPPTIDYYKMKSAKGTINGQVSINTQEPTYLVNVNVALLDKSSNKVLATTTTGDKGFYSLEYDTGTYSIKYELNGYDTVTSDISIAENMTITKDVTLKHNQSYFGLDLSHALMILGGTLAVVLLLFTLFMRMRLSKR